MAKCLLCGKRITGTYVYSKWTGNYGCGKCMVKLGLEKKPRRAQKQVAA
jgi:hypothetical protein